ncbi:hypothetical protein SLEP1_g14022 [Rubroshorea leprosula]|uniref:Uncharacterized protein n=1 Tax=Rubroshorea leprosula TaxID=152421 RepID=A0AAV5IHR7_9ROSI|nr:hypothetical protein SLEP1_g14022 [Rubroshorea leprosula]
MMCRHDMQNVEDKFSRVQFHCQLWFSLIPSKDSLQFQLRVFEGNR